MIDLMLRELGVNSNKKKGHMEDFFGLYRPADYFGLVDEWTGFEINFF